MSASPLDTCRFWRCQCVWDLDVVVWFVNSCLDGNQWDVKVKKWWATTMTEKLKWNQSQNCKTSSKNKTEKKSKNFCFGGRCKKATEISGTVLQIFPTKRADGAVRTLPILRRIWGRTTTTTKMTTKGSLWAWEFLFARFFIIIFLFF